MLSKLNNLILLLLQITYISRKKQKWKNTVIKGAGKIFVKRKNYERKAKTQNGIRKTETSMVQRN